MPRFCFAWVDASETAFAPAHHRVDVQILRLEFERREGDFPLLSITIRNPRQGLLAATRKRWAWLAWDGGSSVRPFFFGRVVAIPSGILGESITYLLRAEPSDIAAQKASLAAALKAGGGYDPVFVDEALRNDPDTVLEGYPRLWHFDPVTHEVTTSDILTGEGGVAEFGAGDVPYDSVDLQIVRTPLRQVTIDADVTWTQADTGSVALADRVIQTYTGDGFLSDWPKPGATLGGGWSVASSSIRDVYNVAQALTATWSGSLTNNAKEHNNGDTLSISWSATKPQIGENLQTVLTERVQTGILDPYGDPQVNIPASSQVTTMHVPLWTLEASLTLRYDASRQRSERLRFTLAAGLQDVLSEAGDGESETISLSGADVGVPLVTGSEGSAADIPIGNVARRSYFPTDRGLESVEYLVGVARARLMLGARAVEVSFDCRMERIFDLSLRMNGRLIDHRLPGGAATGKVVRCGIRAENGSIRGFVTIGCAVGAGEAVAAVTGTPDYVEEGYVEAAYQHYTGSTVLLGAGDVGYSVPEDAANDDGLVFPLTRAQAVLVETMRGTLAAQETAITAAFRAERERANLTLSAGSAAESINAQQRLNDLNRRGVAEAMRNNPIWLDLHLVPVTNGPFSVEYALTVTDLTIPKQIDLAA